MKLRSGLLTAGLLATFVASACATPEHVVVRPACEPVVMPALPLLDRGELWQALGDARYRELERYILKLWAFADEQSAMLDAICNRD